MNRSSTVGMPSVRIPLPSGLGMSTRRTGCGMYVPLSSCFRRRAQRWRQYGIRSSTDIPSTPGAPPLCTTRACTRQQIVTPLSPMTSVT